MILTNAISVDYLTLIDSENIDLVACNGTTALHTACYFGHLTIVKLLIQKALKKSINVFTLNDRSQTILHSACLKIRDWTRVHSQRKIVEFILLMSYCSDVTLDLDHQDHDGKTALHYACSHGDTQVVKVLFEAVKEGRIDATICDHDNRTILHSWSLGYGAGAGSDFTLNLILREYRILGLDIKHCDNFGRTALDYVNIMEFKELLQKEYSKLDAKKPKLG